MKPHVPILAAVMIGISASLILLVCAALVVAELLAPGSVTDTIGAGWVKWALGALAVALSPAVAGVALLAARDVFQQD